MKITSAVFLKLGALRRHPVALLLVRGEGKPHVGEGVANDLAISG